MTHVLNLNGPWSLSWSEDGPEALLWDAPTGHLWLTADVPAPVHLTLMEAGLAEDPNYGINSLKARWVEEQFWVYRKSFHVGAELLRGSQWLEFEWLEHVARVWLNGQEIGKHANSHRRAVFDVTGKLREGENTLLVLIESGLHEVGDRPVGGYGFDRFARITRRPLLRKAQYQCGWDWNPRLMNVGILGDVRLVCSEEPVPEGWSIVATVDPSLMEGLLRCRVWLRWPENAQAASYRFRASVSELAVSAESVIEPPSAGASLTEHCLEIPVQQPELWWPRGHGEQRLYDVTLEVQGPSVAQPIRLRTGFRRVELDQSPHPEGGRHFVLRVNNRPIFCKGGNWVPPDLMPSRVSADRYRKLVRLAAEANFNTLRVWGGGVFADPRFLDACDEEGILVWHDFLFACAKYPGDDPDFVTEVEHETREAVRRLSRHPSLLVWCGNNEVEWGDREWGYRQRAPVAPHHALFHYHIPSIVASEDPSKLYWPSSPWSPDYASPNDPSCGDQHPWGVSILEPGPADFHKYREYTDRFPNEGGVLGAGLPVTLKAFLPANEQELLSPSWVHHDNPIAFRASQPGHEGRVYETFRHWTGIDPHSLSLEEYALLSGLLQAEGLTEYIVNYRRRMFSSSSAIFWMYNDSWPATHSWTIVDYYLRRRLAYHPVRRAFQPIIVVVAREGDRIRWYGVNDTPNASHGVLDFGIFSLEGRYLERQQRPAHLAPNAATPLADMPFSIWEQAGTRRSGAFGLLTREDTLVSQHRLFLHPFHEMEFVERPVQVEREGAVLMLSCDAFAWGVCLDPDGSGAAQDDCLDLLPGVRYTVAWSEPGGYPAPWVGSHALLRALRRES